MGRLASWRTGGGTGRGAGAGGREGRGGRRSGGRELIIQMKLIDKAKIYRLYRFKKEK